MKRTGIIRKIDELGRIVIPKEIRDTNNWNVGDKMEMFITNEGMFAIQKFVDKCPITNEYLNSDNTVMINNYALSKSAIELIKNTDC